MIFNPAAGRRRAGRTLAAYRELLAGRVAHFTSAVTTFPGEERDLAERAIDDGAEVVVAVGGDGTWSAVADRIVASGREDVALGILPAGTGNDFGRSLGMPARDPRAAVEVLARGAVRRVDVGLVSTPSASEHDPERVEARHFLNVVGFGFDIAVIDAAARARFLRGELLYKVTALQQLFRFPGLEASLTSERGVTRRARHLMLTVSNGRFFGGGFPIAPDAAADDGLLHACRIEDAGPLTRLRLFNMAEKGRHPGSDRVEILSERSFTLEFSTPPRFEVDGDVRQAHDTSVSLRVLPGALRVVAPDDSAVQST